jgi:hypothetical protein
MIVFANLDHQFDEDEDPEIYGAFSELRCLLSCLTPDFATLTVPSSNGTRTLDREAIMDCSRFFMRAVGRNRDRGAGNWGMLFYFQVQIEMMFGATDEDIDKVFEFSVKHISKATYEMTNHSNILHQLILAIHRVRTVLATNPTIPEHKCIFWHNFRTECKPLTCAQPCIAIRLDAVCNVISEQTGLTIKPTEVLDEMKSSDHFLTGTASFYNCMHGWPCAKHVVDETGQYRAAVPLQECELLESTLTQQKCVFILRQEYNRVVTSMESAGSKNVDYKSISFRSSNPNYNNGEPYNFYNVLVNSKNGPSETDKDLTWFGWRVQAETSFANYCGATNKYLCGASGSHEHEFDMEVVKLNKEKGFDSVQEIYQPHNLRKYYGYDWPDPETMPPCLLHPPFQFRNEPNDDPMPREFRDDELPDPDDPYQMPSPAGMPMKESHGTPRSRNNKKSPLCADSLEDEQQQDGKCRISPISPARDIGSVLASAKKASGGIPDSLASSLNSTPVGHKNQRKKRKVSFIEAEAEDSESMSTSEEEQEPTSQDKAFINDEPEEGDEEAAYAAFADGVWDM